MARRRVPPKRVEIRERKKVRNVMARRKRAQARLEAVEREYRQTLDEAMKAGIPATMVARWIGLTWQRVYQLVPLRTTSGARQRPERNDNGRISGSKTQGKKRRTAA